MRLQARMNPKQKTKMRHADRANFSKRRETDLPVQLYQSVSGGFGARGIQCRKAAYRHADCRASIQRFDGDATGRGARASPTLVAHPSADLASDPEIYPWPGIPGGSRIFAVGGNCTVRRSHRKWRWGDRDSRFVGKACSRRVGFLSGKQLTRKNSLRRVVLLP